ncbi:MAG: acyltransferase family protein [Anaerolineales bacterium]
MDAKPKTRNNYLDWLRVIGILVVFIYHSTRFYNVESWTVKNEIWYPVVELWNGFATSWMMPLMFTISGASLFYAMGKAGFGRFFKDKILRLLVPLVFSILTHISLQSYLDSYSHGLFSGSYFQYLPQYYLTALDIRGAHLWYLLFLFVYSILLYPLFRWLKGSGQGFLSRVSRKTSGTVVLYTLTLPILLLYLVIPSDSVLLESNGGYPYIMYLWFIVLGFLLVSNQEMQDKIRQLRWFSTAAGPALVFGFIALYSQIANPEEVSPALILAGMMRVFGGWITVLAFFGQGMQFLTVRTPRLDYANEAVLPFYILHQSVLLAVGYIVLQWALPEVVEWAVIVVVSFALIMVIYEYLVRRWNVMRFLFGMKVIAKPAHLPVSPAVQPH